MIIKISLCPICKIEVKQLYPSTPRTYCSRKCQALGKVKVKPNCLICGKGVKRQSLKYCSLECNYKAKLGKPLLKNRKRENRNCLNCNKQFEERPSVRKSYCSSDCRYKHSRKSFKDHYNLTNSANWRDLANKIKKRDGNKCKFCYRAGRLEVHHIIPRKIKEDHSKSNLITLCGRCHYGLEILTSVGYERNPSFNPCVLIRELTNII